MKNLMVVKKVIELFGKVDGMKVLGYGGMVLNIVASLMLSKSQNSAMNETIKKEVEKAIQNRGVQ